jgi:transcriptional regulator with XRE-family HTH domain
MPSIYSRMFKKFKEKRYRDAFLASQIRRMIPKQIRATREAQGMTQQELAEAAHTKQTVISRIEKGNGSGNLTIKSLLNIASALDVGLVIRFEPIDRLIDWTENLSSDDFAPRKSEAILDEMEQAAANTSLPLNGSAIKAARGTGQFHSAPDDSPGNNSQKQRVDAEKTNENTLQRAG